MLSTLTSQSVCPPIKVGDIHQVFFFEDKETFPNGEKCTKSGWYGIDSDSWVSAIQFDTQNYFAFVHDGLNSGLVWSISHWDVVSLNVLDTDGEMMSTEESLEEFLRLFAHYTRYFG